MLMSLSDSERERWRRTEEPVPAKRALELMQRATRTWSSGAIVSCGKERKKSEVATVPSPQQGKEQEIKCH